MTKEQIDKEKIQLLDKVFKYKLNQEVEMDAFNDNWIKGTVLFRQYRDYDKDNVTHIRQSYTINTEHGMYRDVNESQIRLCDEQIRLCDEQTDKENKSLRPHVNISLV